MMQESALQNNKRERLTSPEDLTRFLRVTSPGVWVLMVSIIALLVGMLIWASVSSIKSYATGNAQVDSNRLTLFFEDAQAAQNVELGMKVEIGNTVTTIRSLGVTDKGVFFATADTWLPDGIYAASVEYRSTNVLKLLFR